MVQHITDNDDGDYNDDDGGDDNDAINGDDDNFECDPRKHRLTP